MALRVVQGGPGTLQTVLTVAELNNAVLVVQVMHVYGMCVACVWHVYGMCMACVWHVYGMCMACVWHAYSMRMAACTTTPCSSCR